ncbi:hypothetical protein QQ045_032181 [Rhodiola kirilowii]
MMKMGFARKWEWVSAYSRRHCRSLFFKTRAALKKAMKNNRCRGKDQLRFQYDPSSYALNFDDGCCHLGEDFKRFDLRSCHSVKNGGGLVLVIVFWVNPIAM